ncbi:hypothetical protein BCR36DRAFT_403914 [Piromyces finnis]|uniref:ANTH-domain-containing protein n=1 Tax=Piromyces finnis TaxID=1754191 RepID=A0A1Y1VCF4_9FUNG|nr:hypothetical protein BCR36DRAFT_403914 [Piromyces finnis]|eukprot:ORX52152.1 hypothetical protein BCR36DRAFT_403914 [Piromyces finnis]
MYSNSLRTTNRDTSEHNLTVNIKKALSPEETAPKQKHVRACIVYTWDYKSANSFWTGIKLQPIYGNEVQTFKALITIHKVIKDGHPSVLKDGIRELQWIESIARSPSSNSGMIGGYSPLIQAYITFLSAKLNFHRTHEDFKANFDYEEYISLKGVTDPNEGYESIFDLLILLDKIDNLQKNILSHLSPAANNECRISALVPLIEESYNIYKFLQSMLMAMHKKIGSTDVLKPLRDKFKELHYKLLKFYDNARSIPYLVSLVDVPQLQLDPPQFVEEQVKAISPVTPKPAEVIPQNQDIWTMTKSTSIEIQNQQLIEQQQRYLLQQKQREQQELIIRQQEQERLLMLQQQQQEQERIRQIQQEQERQFLQQQIQMQQQGRVAELESQLVQFKHLAERDKITIDQAEKRIQFMEQQMQQLSLARQQDSAKDTYIQTLEQQLNQLKQRYEVLAKQYAQLRKEHLDLLGKLKTLQQSENTLKQKYLLEVEAAKAEARAKEFAVAEVTREKENLQEEINKIKKQQYEEMNQLRREVADSKNQLLELGKTKGAEFETMLANFTREKEELERNLRIKQVELEDYRNKMNTYIAEAERSQNAKDEEILVLKSGMDQTLLALAQMQKTSQESEGGLAKEIQDLKENHILTLQKIMDSILNSCKIRISDGLFEFDSPNLLGNQSVTAEYVLSVNEKVQSSLSEFGQSFIRYLQGGDQTEPINTSNNYSHSLIDLMNNCKGVVRLSADDTSSERILDTVRKIAKNSQEFFEKIKSTSLNQLQPTQKSDLIIGSTRQIQDNLAELNQLVEKLVPKDISSISNTANEDDIGDVVEREMMNAARVIEDAVSRLNELMKKPKEPSLNLAQTQVHDVILESVMAITNAIANLIKCATAAQKEIVAEGRGTATNSAFYKKNNRWTEGLISAAKSVAIATNYLVEAADGVISGTHKIEQLVVAATEVSAATTQLVAASRVKAVSFSKTQDKLEMASVAVRKATQALVKAAKEASKKSEEDNFADIRNMAYHELKVKEMEQQVLILELERDLNTARQRLAEMRRATYQEAE